MHLQIKDKRIVVQLTEEETLFLSQKAEQAGVKDSISYAKAKLIESLGLETFENNAIVGNSNDFNLAKIKYVTTELNKRKSKKSASKDEDKQADEPKQKASAPKEPTASSDILSELMDQDLLTGQKTPKIKKKGGDLD